MLISLSLGLLAGCGGGGTPPPVTPSNPTPALTSLSPNSVSAGSNSFTLTVNGSGFIAASKVRWNGADRSTVFFSSTQLTAIIPARDIAVDGTALVTVFNPAPGGGTSNALTFTITAAVLNITTTALPDTTGGKAYDFTLASTGGVPDLTWSLAAGTSLPASLTLDPATGRISGTVDPVTMDTPVSFTVQVTDSASTPQTATQPLSITVLATAPGRNDTCTSGTTAGTTAISNGTIRASLSPYADIDVYSFQGTMGAQVTIEIFAQRLELDGDPFTRDSFADTVVELLDANCTQIAQNDDIDLGIIQDSRIVLTLPDTSIFFIRVRDFRGDGRPDLIYELRLAGAN